MKDNRQALKDSSIIFLKDNNDIVTEFTVRKEIGRGGSCIVYEVTYMQDNVQRSGRLKECFPYGIIYDLYREQSNNICVNPAAVESFEIKKNKFKEGCFKQIRLYEEIEGIRNSTVDVRGIYYGNNTIYYLMPCDNGQCYSNPIYENDSIYDVLQTVKSTAVALSYYHQQGYLHLDIKPDNIFVLKETRELIKLFDYDSVIEQDEIRRGNIYLSGTYGYSAQELRKVQEYNNIKFFEKIDFSADIYSLGAVVFRHVFGREVTDNDINRPPIIQKDRALFKDVSHKLFKLLDDFLRKTCLCNKARRYQSIYEKTDIYKKSFIEALDELMELARPLKHPLKKSLPSSITSFQGRQREMQQIKKQLQEGNRQVFLQGQGGIGKTELAIKFAQEFRDVYDSYFVIYNNSMRDTIINLQFENYDNFDENDKYKGDDVIYKDKIGFLSKYDDNTILIIDNFDSKTDDLSEMVNEPAFREVVSCGIIVLITTRNYFEGCIKIGVLSDDELFEIMRCFYTQAEQYKETMYKIINTVGKHTLVVELVAKTLDKSRGRITPEDMYLELSDGNLENEKFRKVKSDKDNYLSEDILYNHIKKLFDMSQLSDAERLIMSNMSLVPITGMDFSLFADLKGAENEDDIDALIDKGWIQIDDESYMISLHPIIKGIVWKENAPNFDRNSSFLLQIKKQLSLKFNWKIDDIRNKAFQISYTSEIIINSVDVDNLVDWCYLLGKMYEHFCYPKITRIKSLYYYNKAVQMIKDGNIIDRMQLAKIYQGLGRAYFHNGEHDNAILYIKKSLNIYEIDFNKNNRQILCEYKNMAFCYYIKEQYYDAISCLLKAVQIVEEYDYSKEELSEIYLSLSYYYSKTDNNRENEYKYLTKSLNVKLTMFPLPVDLPRSFFDLGVFHLDHDDEQAIRYFKKTINLLEPTIKEKIDRIVELRNILPRAYFYISCAYRNINDSKKSFKYAVLAAEKEHSAAQNIVGIYYIEGYGTKQNYEEAFVWIEKSYQNGDTAAINNLGWMYMNGYGCTKNYKKAYNLFMEATKHNKDITFVYLADMYYNALGVDVNLTKALEYYKKARDLGYEGLDEIIFELESKIE